MSGSKPAFSRLNDWIMSSVVNARLHEKPEFKAVIDNLKKLLEDHKVPPMAIHILSQDPAVLREASIYHQKPDLEREIIDVLVNMCKIDFCETIVSCNRPAAEQPKPAETIQLDDGDDSEEEQEQDESETAAEATPVKKKRGRPPKRKVGEPST